MAKFKMKDGRGPLVEVESIHDATTFRQNPEWEEINEEVFPAVAKQQQDGEAVTIVEDTPIVEKQQQRGRPKKDKA